MQMAMAVGDCTGEDADLLRRAMGSKRGRGAIESLREKLYAGHGRERPGRRGSPTTSTRKIQAFANFGFAESHSLSASRCSSTRARGSSCTTRRRSSPGCCAPSRWASTRPRRSPRDARRHGVEVRRPDILRSGVLERGCSSRCESPADVERRSMPDRHGCLHRPHPAAGRRLRPHAPDESADHRRDGALRRAARPRRGQRHRRDGRRAHRRRARARRRLPRHGRPGAPRRAHRRAARGARDRGRLRVPRAHAAARRSGCAGSAAAGPRRVPRPTRSSSVQPPLFADPTALRDARRRPVGDRHLDRRPPDAALPRRARRARGAHLARAARRTRPAAASRSRDS